MLTLLDQPQVEDIIKQSPEGKNTRFLKAAHSLWFRFKNYKSNPPFAWVEGKEVVSIIFATMSLKTRYVNLYEICTIEGQEGKGYATKVWSAFIESAYMSGMRRIKLSCTPSSVTWHLRNGLVFWSVDKQGSLRSDQPLMRTIQEQNDLRLKGINNPELVLPDELTRLRLKKEDIEVQGLNQKQVLRTLNAIQKVGKAWLRKNL